MGKITKTKALANQIFISSIIIFLRGKKVILDFDLALLYQTENRVLKQTVKRNKKRFPPDFVFKLSREEWKELITNCDKFARYKNSPVPPFAFTEQGVAMLSSVLKSEKAIEVNIVIMRTFVQLRTLLETNKHLAHKIAELEAKYDENFQMVFEDIRQLMKEEEKPKNPIGFQIREPKVKYVRNKF